MKVGDRVQPNTAVKWVDDAFPLGSFKGGPATITGRSGSGVFDRYFDVTNAYGENEGLFDPAELILVPQNKRFTISGEKVTILSKGAPDEIVVEVENFAKVESEDFEPTAYVQVAAAGHYRLTYIDPSGSLKVGDRVLVKRGYTNYRVYGEVKALGRGSYTGPCKSVHAKLLVEELS